MNTPELLERYKIRPHGAIVAGAHHGEEVGMLTAYGFEVILLIEPNPRACAYLRHAYGHDPRIAILRTAVGDVNGTGLLHLASNDQSSSLLELGYHKTEYPGIDYVGHVEVQVARLDDLMPSDCYNFMHMDIQGYELQALRGATKLLAKLDAVQVELNHVEMYKGCGLASEVTRLLQQHGLQLRAVDTQWSKNWGDAFYTRNA